MRVEKVAMPEAGTVSVMRRIVRPVHVVVPEPVTPARALRQAMTRAAERSIGLTLSVLGVRQDITPLDDLLTMVDDDLMLAVLTNDSDPVGFVGIDLQTRGAIVETQTLGRVSQTAAVARKATLADLAMAEPLLTLFLREVVQEIAGTALEGWITDQRLQGRFADARAAGLALPDTTYRCVRLTLDLGAGGRQGLIVLTLPMPVPPETTRPAPAAPDWSATLGGNVLGAHAEIAAILHRMRLPLHAVERFALGQIIPLPGVSVASVRMETSAAKLVAQARLGQLSGMRAVRLGQPGRQEMEDTMALPAAKT